MNSTDRGFAKLNFYLDRHPEEDIFSKNAIDMTVEGLQDIEKRGAMAIIAASNKTIREKLGKDITFDILQQGLRLVKRINFLLGIMSIIKTADTLNIGEKVNTLHIFVSEKMLEVIDAEEGLCNLMQSIIHLYKLDDEDFRS